MNKQPALLDETQAKEVRALAVKAGACIMHHLREDRLNPRKKADGSTITAADYAADAMIKEALARITPDIPVLSEEDDIETQRAATQSGTYWCIDPLDGTSNAIGYAERGEPRWFGPLIGLVQNGKPVFGVAHFPVLGEGGVPQTYYTSADGKRSYRREGTGDPVALQVAQPRFSEPLRVAIHASNTPFERIGGRNATTFTRPTSRILQAAEGIADLGYMHAPAEYPPGYWDIAALQAIIKGAGGEVVAMPEQVTGDDATTSLRHAMPLRYDALGPADVPYHRHCLAGSFKALQQVGVPTRDFTLYTTKKKDVSMPRFRSEDIIAIAREAGEAILEELASVDTLDVERKGDDSPVSRADRSANTVVLERLRQLTPEIPILSEEDPLEVQQAVMRQETYWCVDPLDGTRTALDYAKGQKGYTSFGTHIGLVKKGEPVFGVVHYPAAEQGRGVTYFTNPEGTRAYRKTGNSEAYPHFIQTKRLYNTVRMLVAEGHKSEKLGTLCGIKAIAYPEVGGRRITRVAEGDLHAAYMTGSDHASCGYWDVAAPHAILRAAGGEVVTLPGSMEQHRLEGALAASEPVRYDGSHYPEAMGPGKPYLPPTMAADRNTLRDLGAPLKEAGIAR